MGWLDTLSKWANIVSDVAEPAANLAAGYFGYDAYKRGEAAADAGARYANVGLGRLADVGAEQRGMQRTAFDAQMSNREQALEAWDNIQAALGDMDDPRVRGIVEYLLGGGDISRINIPGFQEQYNVIDAVAKNNLDYTNREIERASKIETDKLIRAIPHESGGARMRILAEAARRTKDLKAQAEDRIMSEAWQKKRDFTVQWQKELTNWALRYKQAMGSAQATGLQAGMQLPNVASPQLSTGGPQDYLTYGARERELGSDAQTSAMTGFGQMVGRWGEDEENPYKRLYEEELAKDKGLTEDDVAALSGSPTEEELVTWSGEDMPQSRKYTTPSRESWLPTPK